ncbi:hypothetical protein AAZX31_18G158500 [Glycine max]
MDVKAEIDRLPIDLLAHIFVLFTSFIDLAHIRVASGVCKKWKQGVKESLARRHNLSFTGWKMDDDSTAHLVYHAYNLTKLDMEAWLHGKTKADSVGNVPCYLENYGLDVVSS